MLELYTLSVITFLPLVGAILMALFVKGDEASVARSSRNIALWISLGNFLLSLKLWYKFDPNVVGFQFVENISWFADYKISYHMGIDGISLFFILLTTLLTPICILSSFGSIKKRVREYMINFLVLESLVIGVFCALDLLVFYVFFEAVLIPMFLIIGIWGGENRIYASFKFFLYTLTGSVLFLIALLYIYVNLGTTDIATLMEIMPGKVSLDVQKLLWLALFASFAVKVPMWPVHTWLPDAHVQAPTGGSVILAGILLKLGGYGFLRLSLPLLPAASVYFADFVIILSIIAIIYTSFVALMQEDMKKLIAYSSVAHMGFVTLGIFTFNEQGIVGSIFVMISHGLVSAALFLCVGVLYDRVHTKEIKKYGGVAARMPMFAAIFMIFTMASIGLPGTSGFVGELLSMAGLFKVSKIFTALAAIGVILGAAYMLWLYKRVMFGDLAGGEVAKVQDLVLTEKIFFVPIVLLVILFGIYPSLIMDDVYVSVNNLLSQVKIGAFVSGVE